MDNNYYFSNILVDQDPTTAEKARDTYWEPKKEIEVGLLVATKIIVWSASRERPQGQFTHGPRCHNKNGLGAQWIVLSWSADSNFDSILNAFASLI